MLRLRASSFVVLWMVGGCGEHHGGASGAAASRGDMDASADVRSPSHEVATHDCKNIGEPYAVPYCVGDYCLEDPELPLNRPVLVAGSSEFDVWLLQENGELIHRGCDGWSRVPDAFDVVPLCATEEERSYCLETLYESCDEDCPEDTCPDVCTLVTPAPGEAWLESKDELWRFDGTQFRRFEDRAAGPTLLMQAAGAVWITVDGDDSTATRAYRFEDDAFVSHSGGALEAMRVKLLTGSGPDDVWASDLKRVVRWDGSAWLELDSIEERTWAALAVLAPDDAWFIQPGTPRQHWDGTSWSMNEAPMNAHDAFVVGDEVCFTSYVLDDQQQDRIELECVAGQRSTKLLYPPAETLHDYVVGDAVWFSHALGDSNYFRLARVEGDAWHTELREDPRLLNPMAIAGVASGDVWLLSQGEIWHRGPKGYENIGTFDTQYGLYARAQDELWSFGAELIRWDGEQWQTPATPSAEIRKVWASASSDVWVITETGIEHLDGDGVLTHEYSWDGKLGFSIWGSAADDIWVSGSTAGEYDDGGPWIVHWDGEAWLEHAVPDVSTPLWQVGGTGPNDVWFATDGHAYRWNGVEFVDETPSDNQELSIVQAGDDALLLCAGGKISVWDGETLEPSEVEPSICPWTATNPHDLWLVGQNTSYVKGDSPLWQGVWHAQGSRQRAVGASDL